MAPHFSNRTEHLNTSDITSHGTDSFGVKPITPGHAIPNISTRLTMFWESTWKTKFVKTIHRQESTSLEKKSDGFHKKCSIELWTIFTLELLLCYVCVLCLFFSTVEASLDCNKTMNVTPEIKPAMLRWGNHWGKCCKIIRNFFRLKNI